MFRVLSDEESKRVTRWKAPEFGNEGSSAIAETPQFARAQATDPQDSVTPLLGSLELKPEGGNQQSAFPELPPGSSARVPSEYLSFQSGGLMSGVVATSAELLQSSYDEGYEKGYADGCAALQQQSVNELSKVVTALKAACDHRTDAELEQQLVALTLDIASLVVRRELSVDDTIMHNIVAAGLDQLPGASSENISVHLHPLDAETVHKYQQDDVELRIVDDPLVARGSCRIESGSSIVNSGVDDWLESVAVQLGLTAARSESGAAEHINNGSDDNISMGLTGS